jgi:hypothetical protein
VYKKTVQRSLGAVSKYRPGARMHVLGYLLGLVYYVAVPLTLLSPVGLYKLNPVEPQLESAWFQPLKLKCDILVSKLCFQIQIVPLNSGGVAVGARLRGTRVRCGGYGHPARGAGRGVRGLPGRAGVGGGGVGRVGTFHHVTLQSKHGSVDGSQYSYDPRNQPDTRE